MADESNPQTSPSEGSPHGKLPEVNVPSSQATELNTMTQGDLDRLRETCSFPMGVHTRIPRKGETVLSASSGEVAFYEAVFPASLRVGVRMALFQGETGQEHLERGLSNIKGWKRRFFFVSGDDWEFHLTIPHEEGVVRVPRSWGAPGKQCNKVPVLSPTEEERFHQVFEKIGEGHFKIPVILNSRTIYKYFAPGRVEVSSSGGSMAKGDIGGEAEGDIRGEVADAGHASESSRSTDVSRPDAPSREDSVEFIGTIAEEMRRIFLHASDLDLLGRSGLRSQSDSGLSPELRSNAMSKRIKLSELAKVVAQKAAAPSSKGVIISEGSETASKKRASDDGSKGKQVVPLPEAKKIKIGSDAHAAPTRPPVVPGEGSSARQTLGEALGPQASVMASAATVEKILAGVILPVDKEKVKKLTFDQVVTKFLHVLGQVFVFFLEASFVISPVWAIELEGALAEEKAKGKKAAEEVEARNEVVAKLEARVVELEKNQSLSVRRIIAAFKESDDFLEALAHHYPNLGVDLEDIEMDQDFLAHEEIEAERKAAEDKGEVEAGGEEKGD
ncbi:hypothetical protein Acr_00g0079240 [Actinidia rufa]|uniref:Uncharacterized protein n=1 Tax=Actinidia rufa TaxID=165716 RepID=A0A7J0DU30_9ERIC|nr:hypothetical protein Acr_00g0079240 [Actinidia rufa]